MHGELLPRWQRVFRVIAGEVSAEHVRSSESTGPPTPASAMAAGVPSVSFMSGNGVKSVVARHRTLMENLYRTLQGLDKIEDLDEENPALTELKRVILLRIADLELREREGPDAA